MIEIATEQLRKKFDLAITALDTIESCLLEIAEAIVEGEIECEAKRLVELLKPAFLEYAPTRGGGNLDSIQKKEWADHFFNVSMGYAKQEKEAKIEMETAQSKKIILEMLSDYIARNA